VTLWLVVLAAVLVVAGVILLAARQRAVARERQRVAALNVLAERVQAAVASVRPPRLPPAEPSPAHDPATLLVADRLPGRAALVAAVAAQVRHARSDGSRLAVALATVKGGTTSEGLVEAVRVATEGPVYAVGPSSVAFTLPGVGRAEALGVLARIEAAAASSGRAVELEPGEDAVELVARLLCRPAGAA